MNGPRYYSSGAAMTAPVEIFTMRSYQAPAAPYVLTLMDGTPCSYAHGAARYPQTLAVCDDFGDLVIVRRWM